MAFEHAPAPVAFASARARARASEDEAPLRILLLDNYDSYTWNLFQQLARVGGRAPQVVRNDELTAAELDAMELDAIVISPGPGHPSRPRDFGICGHAIARPVPLLGVCLGHQGLAVAYGGRVEPAREPVHGRTSAIVHDGTGLFEGIPSGFAAVRYHSLAVALPLPECLEAIAFTSDGVVMALRHRERPQWGVQFHPESIGTEHGDRLIASFLGLARAAARDRERARVGAAGETSSKGPLRAGSLREHVEAADDTPARRCAISAHTRPLSYRRLPWASPEDAFVDLYADEPHAVWLDSACTGAALSRWSFMGAPSRPGDRIVRYDAARRELTIEQDGHTEHRMQSVLAWLERELGPRNASASTSAAPLPFPFHGGYVGYLGYGVGTELGAPEQHETSWPDAVLLGCSRFLAFDHEERAIYIVTEADDPRDAEPWLAEIAARLASLPPAPPPEPEPGSDPITFRLARSREGYLADIATCLAEIRRGETYEVCLTNELVGPPLARPLDAYRMLRSHNPAPFGAYLRLRERAVLSCSPELFLQVEPSGRVLTKPIKGTRPRGTTPAEDERLREALAGSEKDRAENLMIVDLLRNDLGRVCETGSVEVPALMRVESFATVHQLVSTVTGRLPPECSAVACLRAAFPGGSMTGAPKLRTMEIIHALEHRARGVYSGCLGFFSRDGAAKLAMTIRTVVADADATRIGVGGAIVTLSEPQAELEEILLKAHALASGVSLAKTGRADAWNISSEPP
jgi:para-aminobenzoate synthetase